MIIRCNGLCKGHSTHGVYVSSCNFIAVDQWVPNIVMNKWWLRSNLVPSQIIMFASEDSTQKVWGRLPWLQGIVPHFQLISPHFHMSLQLKNPNKTSWKFNSVWVQFFPRIHFVGHFPAPNIHIFANQFSLNIMHFLCLIFSHICTFYVHFTLVHPFLHTLQNLEKCRFQRLHFSSCFVLQSVN